MIDNNYYICYIPIIMIGIIEITDNVKMKKTTDIQEQRQ
jgi:hypothetical protein